MSGADRLVDATVALFRRVPTPVRQAIKARVYPPTLPEGQNAPEFHLRGHDGRYHLLDEDWSLLVFYPGDGTPGCTRQLQDLEAMHGRFAEYGCRVFGINPGSAESHAAFARETGLTFPLLVDRNAATARQYQATIPLRLGSPRVIRTVYLVNPQRKIRLANRGAPSLEAILRSIEALRDASRTGM